MDLDRECLFVYGTLMSGEENAVQMQGGELLGPATLPGAWGLYWIAEYPGLAPLDNGTTVEGELWEVTLPHLARLDAFEGVDGGLYNRVRLQILFKGEERGAWVFQYARDLSGARLLGSSWRRR